MEKSYGKYKYKPARKIEIDEVTKEIFIKALELESINVYPKGEFEIFFFDGDLFAGHGVVVRGNIDGNFDSAEMA